MNIQEFTQRTAKFLSADEIARYDTDFEPAYMNANGLDKDEFCSILKYDAAKKLVRELSLVITKMKEDHGKACGEYKVRLQSRDAELDELRAEVSTLASDLRHVSAICDRALTRQGDTSAAYGVAATR